MYNERESVQAVTKKALTVLQSLTTDFEILIIDDGSSDGSEKIADELAASDSRVRVIHHDRNRGYGQALRTGFANASKEIIIYTDCNEPADLWQIRDALPHLDRFDAVIGYRVNRWEGVRRYIYSLGYNNLVRLLYGVHVKDINFSFKLLRREHVRQMRLGAESVFIDGELLAEAVRLKLSIFEMPVKYQPRQHGTSNFNSLRAAMLTLREVLAYRARRATAVALEKATSAAH